MEPEQSLSPELEAYLRNRIPPGHMLLVETEYGSHVIIEDGDGGYVKIGGERTYPEDTLGEHTC